MTVKGSKETPSIEDVVADLRRMPVVPIWPHAAMILDLTRNGAYEAAKRGDFETFRSGRLVKAISAPLRRKIGIEAA